MWLLLISEPEKSQLSMLLFFNRRPDKLEPMNLQRCMLEELNFSFKSFNPEKSASTQFPRDMSQLSFFCCFPESASVENSVNKEASNSASGRSGLSEKEFRTTP